MLLRIYTYFKALGNVTIPPIKMEMEISSLTPEIVYSVEKCANYNDTKEKAHM